ncbi:MAG: hypothetical protein IJ620_06330, partial [Bacteroidales bacterium]|nr:hypothetical protein [Bacteroidales bacterium]
MNIIKHTLLLVLAFMISVGAWAQTPQKYASGTVDVSALRANDTLMEGVTIATSLETKFVFAPERYSIFGSRYATDYSFWRSEPVLIGTDGTIPGSIDVTPYTEQYTDGNAWVVDSVKLSGSYYYCYLAGVTSTLPITEVPRLLDDGSWIFAMPAGNRLVGVEYKSAGALAWSPAVVGGVNVYLGLESAVSFPALSNPNSLDGVRFGSSNTSVATINSSTGEITLVATGSATIYAVFNGNDDFLYDSVYYTLNVLPLPTLTLSTVGNGTVELADITWTDVLNETLTTNQMRNTYTGEHFTVTCTDKGGDYGFFLRTWQGSTATISALQGAIISEVHLTATGWVGAAGAFTSSVGTVSAQNGNAEIIITDVNASSLTIGSGDALGIGNVTIYFTMPILPDGVDFGTADSIYNIRPGAAVVVKATPADYNHLDSWSNGAAINFTLTDTVTVNSDTTITATFEQNAPQLAWTYRGSTDLPMGGVSAYIGFAYDTLNLINWTANNEIRDLYQSNHSAIRIGSTDDGVITYGPNGWE